MYKDWILLYILSSSLHNAEQLISEHLVNTIFQSTFFLLQKYNMFKDWKLLYIFSSSLYNAEQLVSDH